MQKAAQQLSKIFQDSNFAWQLLNAQIDLEMSNIVSGQTIAYLLQLYMRGVQKMNSLTDPRQSYFKNKVTALMTKNTVIKSLKEKPNPINPMKKKNRPDQVPAKQIKEEKPTIKKVQKQLKQQKPVVAPIHQYELIEKRRQLQMRMAYIKEQHGAQSITKIIAQQDHRQQHIISKIQQIMNSHQDRLNQRIKARKLKTSTFRSHSEININQKSTEQTMYQQCQNQFSQQFSPFKQMNVNNKQNPRLSQIFRQTKNDRKCKSLEQFIKDTQSPDKRFRKYTFDQTNPKKSFG